MGKIKGLAACLLLWWPVMTTPNLYIGTPVAAIEFTLTAADGTVAAGGTALTSGGEARIGLSGLPSGCYVLTLTVDGATYEGSFVF